MLKHQNKTTKRWLCGLVFGGDKRDRTADLLNAIQAHSQLSYTPTFNSSALFAALHQKRSDFYH